MVYEILNYPKYQERIKRILNNNPNNPNLVIKQSDLTKSRFGFPIEHYTIGYGENHIILMGGTHGSEIISIDFITQLMQEIAAGQGPFTGFDPGCYTLHFIPVQNPEGFIISSSAIYAALPDYGAFDLSKYEIRDNQLMASANLGSEELMQFLKIQELQARCKEYYLAYRQDDIDAKNQVNLVGEKHRHQNFQSVTPEVLSSYPAIRQSIEKITTATTFPKGSLIDWRANASGVDLNANTPHHEKSLAAQRDNAILYGSMRFNTIRNYIYGPLGVSTLDANKFGYEPENEALFALIQELYQDGYYCGMLTFHGTGGMVYQKPHEKFLTINEEDQPIISRETIAYINSCLADVYCAETTYRKLEAAENTGVGDLIRINYPGEMLIELSQMGGNPLGPYGDIGNNYIKTITTNLKAVARYCALAKELKPYMYPKKEITITLD